MSTISRPVFSIKLCQFWAAEPPCFSFSWICPSLFCTIFQSKFHRIFGGFSRILLAKGGDRFWREKMAGKYSSDSLLTCWPWYRLKVGWNYRYLLLSDVWRTLSGRTVLPLIFWPRFRSYELIIMLELSLGVINLNHLFSLRCRYRGYCHRRAWWSPWTRNQRTTGGGRLIWSRQSHHWPLLRVRRQRLHSAT